MPPQAPSTKFTDAIDGLPDEVQLKLLKKHITTFLDSASEDAAKKTLAHVNKTKARYDSMPQIQFSTRRGEIQGLLDQIERDQKKSSLLPPGFLGVTAGPSSEEVSTRRDELLEEVIHTMTGWFQDIWSAVAEYNAGYSEAHASLIYCIRTIADILDASPSRCKCATSLMTVKVAFRRRCSKPGKFVKRFSETGLEQIYTVIFWLWRELIISAIANGSSTEVINEYLMDIEHVMSWKSLQRVLNGGTAIDEREDDFEDIEGDEDDDGQMWLSDDSEYETAPSGSSSHDQRPKHWPARFKSVFPEFVDIFKTRLQVVFSLEPSAELYQAIQALPISPLSSTESIRQELQVALDNVATSTTSTMLAALRIYADQHLPDKLSPLLSSHSYLLRPHDFAIYQSATKIMATDHRYVPQVLEIIEAELLDSVQSIRHAVISCFSGIEKPRSKHELAQIMKLKSGSLDRKDMVERWVDSILTPGTAINGPMALAAVMMGVGLPFGGVTPMDLQDSDPLSFLDSETLSDPEYAVLREEHRPNLSDRLDGWIRRCNALGKGPELLMKMYKQTFEIIPWIKAPDIIEELVAKIGDRTTKHHLCDALESLNVFAKTQRRKILALHKKNKPPKGSAAAGSASTSKTTASTPPFSFPPPSQPPASAAQQPHEHLPFPFGFQLPIPFNVNIAGDNVFTVNYDDGGSDSDDDGPPMLEPIGITSAAGPLSGPSTSAAHGMDIDNVGPPPLEPVGLSAPSQPTPAPPPALASQTFFDDEPPPLEPVTDSSDEDEDDYEDTDDEDEDEDEDENDSDEDYGMPPPLIPIHPATGQPIAQAQPNAPPPPGPPHPPLHNHPPMPPPGALLLPLLQGFFEDLGVPGGGMNDVD